MALYFSEIDDLITHTLGEPCPPPLTSYSIANTAGRILFSAKPGGWAFAIPPAVSLTLLAGTDVVALPSDFESLVAIKFRQDLAGFCEFVSIDALEDLRSSTATGNNFVYVALGRTSLSATAAPIPQLEIWPTPTITSANAIKLRYKQAWPELDADGNIIPIPTYCYEAYRAIVCAVARAMVEPEELGMSMPQAVEAMAGDLIRLAMRHEGMLQPSLGKMRDSVSSALRYTDWFYTDKVTM